MTKLKPCPHCGETQYLDVRESVECFVSCVNPLCDQMKSTKTEAIQAWNTRHTPSLSDEAILELVYPAFKVWVYDEQFYINFARAVLARAVGDA